MQAVVELLVILMLILAIFLGIAMAINPSRDNGTYDGGVFLCYEDC